MTAVHAHQHAVGADVRARAHELYFLALAGRRAAIEATPPGVEPFPDSEHTIRLPASPPAIGRVTARGWRMVALAHRALHHELGTFRFSLARADTRLGGRLAPGVAGRGDLETLLAAFADRRLALQIFQTLEDLRVDSELLRRFPGLRPDAEAMLAAAAADRRPLHTLAPRTAAMETLVACSLGRPPRLAPAPVADAAGTLVSLAAPLAERGASVEDVALASARAYAAVARLPNLGALGAAGLAEVPRVPAREAPWPEPWPEPARERIEGEAILGVRLPPPPHRDDLAGRVWRAPAPPPPGEQALYRWRTGGPAVARGAAARGIAGPPEPLPHEHHDVARDLRRPEHGPLAPSGPPSRLYPEWDARRGALLPRWCRVIEESAAQSDPRAVHELRRHHQLMVHRLARLMRSAAPRGLAARRTATDGDDIDIDAAIGAVADLHAGRTPDGDIYQQIRPRRRDVAVGLLVDASASTAERLLDAAPLAPAAGPGAPPSYRDRPRVLDVEILATLLCLTAIAMAGDASAAWAFSGTGREAVRMGVLKTLREPFGGQVLRRAAAVTPGHATRMGAAIRHAAATLGAAPCATRLLLVVSDGRPYDLDYGQQYGDQTGAYAWADTAHAVAEATRSGVRTAILAISSAGDGLPPGARAQGVEVLRDINALPERLTGLYRDFTAHPRPAAGRAAGAPHKEREHNEG